MPEMVQELIFRFTPEELSVIQELMILIQDDIPEWMNQDAYDSLFNKVMSN